ncbi:DUF998 domain-containing protein [Mumia zhuanghuii]|uniref:DUF998 domain-containing protein n=2 Tax=Mumia TaxID=1546255 RepID=A0ABW1QQ52_9ACTN|nr:MULTISPECIES: DUF998 domain-containing protein [Mumia]KAA1423890.1 DUF998 domain-containing protein [Mumia zhuanghuii]
MKSWRGVLLVATGVVAGFLYSNFLLDVMVSQDHDWFAVVSELEVPGSPTAGLLRVTDVVCAVLVLALLPWVRAALPASRWRTAGLWLTAVFALGGIVAAIVPLPCRTDEVCTTAADQWQRWVHDGSSIVSAAALFLGAVAVALAADERQRWVRRAGWLTFWIGGVVGILLFGGFAAIDSSSWQSGIAQRFQIAAMSIWIVCLGVLAASAPVSPSAAPRSSPAARSRP